MTKVTVSPKFQIVIPKPVRESIGLMAGETLNVEYDGKDIRLHRVKHPLLLRGLMKGHKNDFKRDKTDRLG
jgi:AbrB family looped-hinge helix DNA binding protein